MYTGLCQPCCDFYVGVAESIHFDIYTNVCLKLAKRDTHSRFNSLKASIYMVINWCFCRPKLASQSFVSVPHPYHLRAARRSAWPDSRDNFIMLLYCLEGLACALASVQVAAWRERLQAPLWRIVFLADRAIALDRRQVCDAICLSQKQDTSFWIIAGKVTRSYLTFLRPSEMKRICSAVAQSSSWPG